MSKETPDKGVRSAYIPHTEREIELIRSCLNDGTYTRQEQKDIGVLCDMAINGLLYAQEIHRLRAEPSAIADTIIKDEAKRIHHLLTTGAPAMAGRDSALLEKLERMSRE